MSSDEGDLANAEHSLEIVELEEEDSSATAAIPEIVEPVDEELRTLEQNAAASSPIPIIRKPSADSLDGGENCHESKPGRTSRADAKSDDEFLTASECTRQHSRASSYNTASDSESAYAQWWDFGSDDMHDGISKEKMVLAIGLPQLPDAEEVLKASPEVPPGKLVREVTETTHIKVQHSHSLGVKSFVLTSETVRDKKNEQSESVVQTQTKIESYFRPDDLPETNLVEQILETNNLLSVQDLAQCKSEPQSVEQPKTETGEGNSEKNQTENEEKLQENTKGFETIEKPELSEEAESITTDENALELEDFARKINECGDWIQLKILEVTPELTNLGNTLQEALDLQRAQDEVLRQLQNKQSPVEELLRQADQLISTQKPRAEVYAAMAESLAKAWKNVNSVLEMRKFILDFNVEYHQRAKDFFESLDVLDAVSSDSFLSTSTEDLKAALNKIHESRRNVLENLRLALQSGNMIIGKLKELGAEGTIDSRPDRIRNSVTRAINQVLEWMEQLHVRRNSLEITFNKRKVQLEQCLAASMLASDLKELEDTVIHRKELLIASDQLGDSSASAELLQSELKKLLPEAHSLQEKALTITKASEQLAQSDTIPTDSTVRRAYDVLAATSDYIEALQQRDLLYEKIIAFFKNAESALGLLDEVDAKLKSKVTGQTLPKLHAQCAKEIEEITADPLSEGYAILESAHRPLGVQNKIEELENKKIYLDGLCVAHKEENRRINQAVNKFLEEQEIQYSWLVNVADAFIAKYTNMGHNLNTVQEFLNLHKQLLSDLTTKGNEINTLLLTLPPIIENLEDSQRHLVDTKVEALHERWMRLKNILESRWDLGERYRKFHSEAEMVTDVMDNLEQAIKECPSISESDLRILEEKLDSLKPLYQSAKNTGLTFVNEASKAGDPELDIKHACGCIGSVLDDLSSRQLIVSRNWQTFHTEVKEKREFEVLVETNMTESTKTINWVSKLDAQLYPIITSSSTKNSDLIDHIEDKVQEILPQVRKAQSEVEERLNLADNLLIRSQDERIKNVRGRLSEMNQKLFSVGSDYQLLAQMMVSYFKNLQGIEESIASYKDKFSECAMPKQSVEIDNFIRQCENQKQTIQNMIRFSNSEREEIISRIRQQEPSDVSQQDVDKIDRQLNIAEETFNKNYTEVKNQIEANRQQQQFDNDLKQVNNALDHLSEQLNIAKQSGESLEDAKNNSQMFVSFEETLKLIEPKVIEFINTGKTLLENKQIDSPHITEPIEGLTNRWDKLKSDAEQTRNLIDLSIKYFELIDDANKWFKDGSDLLSAINKKSELVKVPQDAQDLLDEIEMFLKPGENAQNERIKRIIQLGAEIFGSDNAKSLAVASDNSELMESFNAITRDLSNLQSKLQQQEKEQKAQHQNITQEVLITNVQKITVNKEPSPEKVYQITEVVEKLPKLEAPVFISPLSDQIIQEGSKFTFMCQVTGVPLPVVTWYKDGISIQNNPDYQTTFDQGVCTLSIEETFAEDSARYTCKAINAAGSDETAAHLYVKDIESHDQLVPPNFVKYLEPGAAKEGESFQFECKVEGNPLPNVNWYKNLDCIDNNPDYVITYNNGEALLKFAKIYLHDRADYTCKAYNEVGIAQTTANLNVIPLEPMEIPVFKTPLSNIMARAGQKIKLECEVSGLPAPNVLWSYNGKPLKETSELKLHRDGGKATLIILEAFPKDAGTYAVTASNIAGEVNSSCTITVKGRLPAETSDSELASDMEPVKPSIQVPLKDICINEGNRVRLDCVIVGQPEPEVIWYHNDCPVKESPDFQLLFQGDRCSLIIKEALMEDEGEYKVVALNSAGEASSSAQLTVTPSVDKDAKLDDEQLKITGSAPKFSKLLSDILVSEGEKVILEAAVSGDPRPEVKWLLNNTQINADEQIGITHDPEGNLKLEINNVKPEHRGVYTVKASNCAGDAKCFAQLIVKTLRTNETAKVHEEVKTPPVFKEMFKDRSVFEETSTKFECIVTGKPTPKIKWLFNESPVSGKNFLISTSGDRQVLTLSQVTTENSGKISCVAENEVGKAICEARLQVECSKDITLPEMEKDVSTLVMKSTQELLPATNLEFSSCKQEVSVQSSTSTTSKIISTTAGAEEPYVEEHKYFSKGDKYFKQVNQGAPEIKESYKEEEYHKLGTDPPIVHEKLTTSYSAGASESEVPKIKPAPEPMVAKQKSRPPKFITPVIGKIVDQNADVVLEGILDASPPPEVSWSKNGTTFIAADNAKVSFENMCARVELKNVNVNDAGQYTCTAINNAGKAISTADLVVRKTVFPPVFGRRLQAQVIKKGERILMEVEVTGTPDPEVTWFKDGQPLEDVLKTDCKKISQGNCYRVIINTADTKHTGKYMVRAKNSGGEAQSIADIAVFEPTPDTMVEVVKTVVFEDVRKHETLASAAGQSVEITAVPVPTKPIPVPEIFHSKPETIDSVTTEVSRHVEDTVIRDTKTLTLEKSTPVPDIEFKKQIIDNKVEELSQIPQVDTIEEGIQTSSISKKQSLEFFVKKMQQPEETVIKEVVIPGAIKPEVYTKFEDLKQSYETHKFEPVSIEVPKYEPFIDYSSQSQLYEEFSLKPEPPPEICFTSKPESIKVREDLTEKVKKLEESHREIPESEIPIGGIKIFPTKSTPPKMYEEKMSSKTFESSKSHFYSNQSSEFLKTQSSMPEFTQSPMQFEVPLNVDTYKSSSDATYSKNVEPRLEGLVMEKSWAHKHSSETNMQKSWPPAQSEQPKAPPSWSTQSTMEKKWTPMSSEKIVESHTTTKYPSRVTKQETKTFTSEILPPPLDVPHYVAQVSHTSNIKEMAMMERKESHFEEKRFIGQESESKKASEMIQSWPPKVQKPMPPLIESLPIRPVSVQDITNEIYLEPGTPPEIAYAQPPTQYKPVVPELPPKNKMQIAPPIPAKPIKPIHPAKIIEIKPEFQPIPPAEPFPFKPAPQRPLQPKGAPPPMPSKFIPGKFTDSDYESDFDLRMPAKWKPYASDNEDPAFKHVNPPKFSTLPRSKSSEKEALAPSRFEQPRKLVSCPRPDVNFESYKKQTSLAKTTSKTTQDVSKTYVPLLKPGSPPQYLQSEIRSKPQSPKIKHKVVDGYMADTDEPLTTSFLKSESKSEMKQQYYQQSSQSHTISTPCVPCPQKVAPKFVQQKKSVASSSASFKQKLVSTPIATTQTTTLEPFPFKPDPPAGPKVKVPPPPSPSKFVKGEFKESDYESDYEGRISSNWKSEEKQFKSVRPLLTPTQKPQYRERPATPPSEFENPNLVPMPTKPKFEPIDKLTKTVKLDQIIKPIAKPTPIFKPKPVVKRAYDDVIHATPAMPSQQIEKVIIIQPGPPPEMAYAPGPHKTQYYKSKTSQPYHNAVQTETSNLMHFNESTENSHRTVSMQQTTKVIKFGDKQSSQKTYETLPKPQPERIRQSSVPPPPTPSKFVPGEFKETDYESELEATRIRAKWTPGRDETDEPHYRKVRAPAGVRASSVPASSNRVTTPMEYDKAPPYMPQVIVDSSGKSSQMMSKSTATKIASQYMDNMTNTFKSKTKKFVTDIIDDVNKKTVRKPILKSKDDSDAQVYREESRASQYGTKHVDPDTGIIYFKYDFGYEFGIILPGESKNGQLTQPRKTIIQPPQRSASIEMPVYHETTKPSAVTPQFQPKKFAPGKNVKWEPTSESEMSEVETDGQGLQGTETPQSCLSTPGLQGNKRAPVFITPLRDIAVVSNQSARFECIVQSDPAPTIRWSKDSRMLANTPEYQINFRNGVCRLTIPRAFPGDAGRYTCTATNFVGSVECSAVLQVAGERRSSYI